MNAPPLNVWLLDVNVLIAMTHAAHVHHNEAHLWFGEVRRRRWATCAITQLAFVRLTSNPRVVGGQITPAQAVWALAEMAALPQHEYWPDSPEPLALATLQNPALVGHRQVTDAWLLGLAAQRGQRLATLDRGLVSYALAVGLSDHVELVQAQAPRPKALAPQESRAQYRAAAVAKQRRRGGK